MAQGGGGTAYRDRATEVDTPPPATAQTRTPGHTMPSAGRKTSSEEELHRPAVGSDPPENTMIGSSLGD